MDSQPHTMTWTVRALAASDAPPIKLNNADNDCAQRIVRNYKHHSQRDNIFAAVHSFSFSVFNCIAVYIMRCFG